MIQFSVLNGGASHLGTDFIRTVWQKLVRVRRGPVRTLSYWRTLKHQVYSLATYTGYTGSMVELTTLGMLVCMHGYRVQQYEY